MSKIIITIIVAVVAFYGGYVYGNKMGYDRGLNEGSVLEEQSSIESGAQVDTGYQNPFDGVKFNPFK